MRLEVLPSVEPRDGVRHQRHAWRIERQHVREQRASRIHGDARLPDDRARVDRPVRDVMERAADIPLASQERAERGQHATIGGEKTGMQVQDAELRYGDRRGLEDRAVSNGEDEIGGKALQECEPIAYVGIR